MSVLGYAGQFSALKEGFTLLYVPRELLNCHEAGGEGVGVSSVEKPLAQSRLSVYTGFKRPLLMSCILSRNT